MSESEQDRVPPDRGPGFANVLRRIWIAILSGSVDADRMLDHVRDQSISEYLDIFECSRIIELFDELSELDGEENAQDLACASTILAFVIMAHAEAARQGGYYLYAYQLVNACIPVLEEHAHPDKSRGARHQRANLLDDLARYDEALAEYDELLSRINETSEPGLALECRVNRVTTLIHLGRISEAVSEWDHLLPAAERIYDQKTLATIYRNHSTLWAELRISDRAKQASEQALRYALSHGDADDIAEGWVNCGNVCLEGKEFERALYCYDAALGIFDDMKRHSLDAIYGAVEKEARCRMHRAIALKRSGSHHDEVIAEYQKSLGFYEGLRIDPGATMCRLNLAIQLGDAGRHDEALSLFESIDVDQLARLNRFQFHGALGIALWNAGQKPRALDELKASRGFIEGDLALSGVDESTLDFISHRHENLHLEVRAALDLGREGDAYEAARAGKASLFGMLRDRIFRPPADESSRLLPARASLIDLIRSDPQLERSLAHPDSPVRLAIDLFLREKRVAQGRPGKNRGDEPVRGDGRISLGMIQQSLPARWALIDFWWTGPEDLVAFVVTGNELIIEPLRLPLESKGLREKLRHLEAALVGKGDPSDDEALYDLDHYLFEPLRPYLRGITGLYLVPHGALHAWPLHACRRYENSKDVSLGDEFQIAYLPSASLLPQLPIPRWEGGVFSLSNPGRGGRDSLPFAEWEAYRLRGLFDKNKSDFYGGSEARTTQLDRWGNASLVHFSCHGAGVAPFSPLSHLHLRDDLLLAHDVTHRLPPLREGSLVLLNGCETGVRDWRAVDEGMGLMTAFLLRGAGLVLSTQWRINDCCAAEMAISFVEAWVRGESPTAALQASQLHVRSMNVESIVNRCEDVYQFLSEAGLRHERARLREYESWMCRQGNLGDLSRQCAREAEMDYRALGQYADARRLAHARTINMDAIRSDQPPSFDHPRYWAAFQLIGRIQ